MNLNYSKIAILGLKVLVAAVSGAVVFAGIRELGKSNSNQGPQSIDDMPAEQQIKERGFSTVPPRGSNPSYNTGVQAQPQNQCGGNAMNSEFGRNVVNGLKIGQMVCGSTMEIIQSLSSVASNVNRLFDKNSYNLINDPSLSTGYSGYQTVPGDLSTDWMGRSYDGMVNEKGEPYNVKLYTTNPYTGITTCYINRPGNVIEFVKM